jgi:hypothetical protein
MLSAEGAVLAPLQTVRSVLLVLDRVVVSLLAFFATKGNFYSCACSHFFGTSYFIYPRMAGIASLYKTTGNAVRTEKSAQKQTSRPTGKTDYSTAHSPGQQFFAGISGFFSGKPACACGAERSVLY